MNHDKSLSRTAAKGAENSRFKAFIRFEGRLLQRIHSRFFSERGNAKRASRWTSVVGFFAVTACLLFGAIQLQAKSNNDDPAAHALFDKMIETLCNAESLSYKSDYKIGRGDRVISGFAYTAWMKKPKYFRIESIGNDGKKAGTFVGDGEYLWVYWPGERPPFTIEERHGEFGEEARSKVYIKEATPTTKEGDSIWYKIEWLGVGTLRPIIDPSTFHGYGYTISFLKPRIHEVKNIGMENIGDIECDIIELRVELRQEENWQFWLSKRDHLPRKLKRILPRSNGNIITEELWSDVSVDTDIPAEKFTWTPPQGWSQYHLPDPEEGLLKPGQDVPDFELLSAEGTKIKLSDYRGKIVWYYSWWSNVPDCRLEMCELQKYYQKYKDKNLVVLGFNCHDDKQKALDFLRHNTVTFPNVIDMSDAAKNYTMSRVMLSYIIDTEGKVVDCWFGGYDPNYERAIAALKKLGVEIEKP
jgi:peroxiredoxin/outer membrane lipoprotein-sorting protein